MLEQRYFEHMAFMFVTSVAHGKLHMNKEMRWEAQNNWSGQKKKETWERETTYRRIVPASLLWVCILNMAHYVSKAERVQKPTNRPNNTLLGLHAFTISLNLELILEDTTKLARTCHLMMSLSAKMHKSQHHSYNRISTVAVKICL